MCRTDRRVDARPTPVFCPCVAENDNNDTSRCTLLMVCFQTPRTYCASKTEDLSDVIEHVGKRFPGSPIMAVGVSLGGYVWLNPFCF